MKHWSHLHTTLYKDFVPSDIYYVPFRRRVTTGWLEWLYFTRRDKTNFQSPETDAFSLNIVYFQMTIHLIQVLYKLHNSHHTNSKIIHFYVWPTRNHFPKEIYGLLFSTRNSNAKVQYQNLMTCFSSTINMITQFYIHYFLLPRSTVLKLVV